MEMQFIAGANLPYPHKCSYCGVENSDSIDLGFDIEDDPLAVEERIVGRNAGLLCVDCARQVADLLGYVIPESDINIELEFQEYKEEVGEWVNGLSSFVSARSDSVITEHNTKRDSTVESTKANRKSSTGQSNEPSVSKGPDDVPSDSSNESGFSELLSK